MSNTNVKFIEPIDNDFQLIQSAYLDIASAFRRGDVISFKRLKAAWDVGDVLANPLSRVREAIVNYYEDGDFAKEVRSNLINNHMGALEFTKVVLAQQNQFIKIQFADTVTHYFNNVEDSQWQVEVMLNERDTMSDAEFYKAVQFQFIQYFKWLEEQFYWIYPLYQPYLLGYDDFKNSPNLPEHIQLNYGADNQAVIKDLHEFLHPAYIDDAFEVFAAHFQANSLYTKMQWKRTQKGLAVLFHGIKTGKNYERIFLKMRNKVNSVISQHFINNKGKDITVENADKSKDSIDPGVSSKDGNDILILLKMLNEKYKGGNVGNK
ncbi:hypothetical protein [Mucilaginibacter gilvus]|uniref:Uncharacterized protein n=1 Tax=Mucilaginibacter gilvus TaxID=2305909 RepID=A0A444MM89_9SPHI|nr:hypothetical protein [Mucilaginibacter gilvus]RWY50392.1 hypothetical protein EPL05_16780 [Mucilaginibacter gilvus]